MKEQILQLRVEGKTYNEIVEILGCSKSTVSYYCGKDQKEKCYIRNKDWKFKNLSKKTYFFNNRESSKLRRSSGEFARDKEHKKPVKQLFGYKDVLKKFGKDTKCYLSGQKINLIEDEYAFDHIIPRSKGGLNTLDNLGVTTKKVNFMKSDLLVEEFLELSKKILEYNGYKVIK